MPTYLSSKRSIKTYFLFYLLPLTLSFSCSGGTLQDPEKAHNSLSPKLSKNKPAPKDLRPADTGDTLKGIYRIKDKVLPYTLMRFKEAETSEKMVFIVFLHGAGERGSNNSSQLTVGLPNLISTLKKLGLKNFMVFAPQCPISERWVDTDWSAPSHSMQEIPHWPLNATLSILDSIVESDSSLDINRIYATGLSMGGYGTWELIQRRPRFFAAALPICGGGDKTLGDRLVFTPIWMFHGTADKVVPVSRTKDMNAAINQALGSNPSIAKMTLFENKGHLIWNQVYDNPEVIKWLLGQKKSLN